MPKIKKQLVIEKRLKHKDSYCREQFCDKCEAKESKGKCKTKIANENNPCYNSLKRLEYALKDKVKPSEQEFSIEIINERNETQFVKIDTRKKHGQVWFISQEESGSRFIERDATVIIDYLLSERRKGKIKFNEITAKPLNAWRKDGKKSKAVELNLSLKNGQASILPTENIATFVEREKTLTTQADSNILPQEVRRTKGDELERMISRADKLLKPKLYISGSSAVNSKLTAPSPRETLLSLRRPYWSINDMPYEYIFNKVFEWTANHTDCILEPVAAMDEDGKPIMESYQYMGETKHRPKITYAEKYVYKNVPTLTGLAMALGVSLRSVHYYISNADDPDYNAPNRRNKIITAENTDPDSLLCQIYGQNVLYANKNEKDFKLQILLRARSEVDNFHEKRLGLNENVSGSMMYLFNSKALEHGGTWSNNHNVTVEAGQSLLGRVLTREELDRLTENRAENGTEQIEIEVDFEEDAE